MKLGVKVSAPIAAKKTAAPAADPSDKHKGQLFSGEVKLTGKRAGQLFTHTEMVEVRSSTIFGAPNRATKAALAAFKKANPGKTRWVNISVSVDPLDA